MLCHPIDQRTAITAINPDEAQLFAVAAQTPEDQSRSITLLHRSSTDDDQQEQAESINQQMPLAPFNLLGGVKTSDALNFSSLDTLRVQTSSGRMLVASDFSA